MDDLKKKELYKECSLALKASDSEKSDLTEEQVSFLAKKFKKFCKKRKAYDKRGTSRKMQFNDKSQTGCYKYEKTDHIIKECPQ